VTQEHNIWALEYSVIRVGRAAQSKWMTDFSDLSTWMTEFSATRKLCSCVTLGFCVYLCNPEKKNPEIFHLI
jgi:hypothetical protein